jgi:hypothetical protein
MLEGVIVKLFDALKRTVAILDQYRACWALCGGVAASVYRDTPRFTGDIDIAIINTAGNAAKDIAQEVCKTLGYKPLAGWVTDHAGELIRPQALVLGREDNQGTFVGIDFLLPVLPWIPLAVERAQANCLDFGFALLPTITLEDLWDHRRI